jgi:4-aminobutyrate aminotransferase-like enzyme
MNNAYHGHTNTLIDLSPYKFNGKGGLGQKNYVHIAKMPDGIRGQWKYSDKFWVKKYIQQVQNLIDEIYANNKKLSCFIIESILGCGGQIILPPAYLKEVFMLIRKKNALCIIDEIQTGFGRVGNNFWAFEEHDVIPDIVTLGKPMGNGHPISAVVTTTEIATTFNNGMEYFNSFGGNPVSCAVGNAVLKVIDNEELQKHAKEVGNYFLSSLKIIQKKYSQRISEIRGRGLFLGIDIINENNNCPDKQLAKKIINNMRNSGILVSTDGPFHNVIKIKPPMPFSKNNVDFFLEIFKQNISNI